MKYIFLIHILFFGFFNSIAQKSSSTTKRVELKNIKSNSSGTSSPNSGSGEIKRTLRFPDLKINLTESDGSPVVGNIKSLFNDESLINKKLDAEETIRLYYEIENSGNGIAQNVRISTQFNSSLNEQKPLISIKNPSKKVNIIDGKKITGYLELYAERNIIDDKVEIVLVAEEEEGYNSPSISYSIETGKYRMPNIEISSSYKTYKDLNNDRMLDDNEKKDYDINVEAREYVEFIYTIRNTGGGVAKNVRLRLDAPDNYLTSNETENVIQNIFYRTMQPGEEREYRHTYLIKPSFQNSKEMRVDFIDGNTGKLNQIILANASLNQGPTRFGGTEGKEINITKPMIENDILDINLPRVRQNNSRFAIIIGIENYKDSEQSDFFNVPGALNDVAKIELYFRESLGIPSGNIIRLNDPSRTDFLKVIASNPKFPSNRTLTSDSELFFYYSGHGYVNPQNQKQYFLTVDSDDDLLDETAVSQDNFYKYLDKWSYNEINLFIDACFSGDNSSKDGSFVGREYIPGEGTKGRRISLDKKTSWSNYKNIKDKAFVLSATNSEGRAYTFNFISKERNKLGLDDPINNVSENRELREEHSLFTTYLCLGLEGEADINNDGKIGMRELQQYLEDQLLKKTSNLLKFEEQVPEIRCEGNDCEMDRILLRLN